MGGEGGDKKRLYRFEMTRSIPAYLLALAVGDLVSAEIGPRSRVWAEPAMLEAATAEFEGVTEKFLSVGEELYGPYVWGIYDLLVMPPGTYLKCRNCMYACGRGGGDVFTSDRTNPSTKKRISLRGHGKSSGHVLDALPDCRGRKPGGHCGTRDFPQLVWEFGHKRLLVGVLSERGAVRDWFAALYL